ncbi:MAG: hypothetical protein K9H61_05840 [Bacteroidia bacterium]|nr:hypothetical protein [Bacteroidia bacterium]MCF8426123.1 hypothetical protein [Bacteroidia bacterium]MCF8446499.1 hypothetical protein [Bacteroidia bacterium]
MKKHIPFVLILFCASLLLAQTAKPKFIPNPAGFVYVPTNPNNPKSYSFYVMVEPVKNEDFRDFIAWLYKQNRLIDASQSLSCVPSDVKPNATYSILSSPTAIKLYGEYLSKKLSTKEVRATCRLISEKEWKQMKGPIEGELPSTKNPYGVKFVKNIYEWKIGNSGQPEAFKDINGYIRAGYRFVLTQTPLLP